ncbi:hypothetical protein [Streptomyces nogalater]|uniref:Uncharacterized protein n=1 Tax=Streptomyces nogalater TaxID=38314 RepID=A0ABW0WDC4_STRNO
MNEPQSLAEKITTRAEVALAREADVRADFTASITAGAALTPYILKPVMVAEAEAQPWRQVARAIKRGTDPVAALREAREDATETLLETAPTRSTDGLTNEADHIQREALRKFLRDTRRAIA